ncbi:hypothetical protein FRC08_000278 [Ceratobasidium sp. 394]|nr:hypothetical protein FRC08_000278 [Ceratobasidium sp. 394]
MEALYEENGDPRWFKQEGDSEILVPHFDLSFQENMDGWGEVFDAMVTTQLRMPENDRAHLQTISTSTFRSVLSTGAFATMKEAWKKNQDGKGEERMEQKKANSRRGNRKATKAKRRGAGLDDSPLDRATFGFLADPAFQSSDYSDPENKKRCVVHEPAYRTEVVTQLLDALDRKYQSMKKRGGNPIYTEFEHRLVDVPVPSLTGVKGKVPGWGVDTKAIKGDLERASRPFLNKAATEMPDQDVVKQFLHDYEPDERKYLDAPGRNLENQGKNDAQVVAVVPPTPADAEPSVDAEEPSTISDAEEPHTNIAPAVVAVVAAVAPPVVTAIAAVAPPAVVPPATSESAPGASAVEESASKSKLNQEAAQPATRSSKRPRKTTAKAAEGAESGEESPEPAAQPAKKSKKEPKKPKTPKEPKKPKGKAAKAAKGKEAEVPVPGPSSAPSGSSNIKKIHFKPIQEDEPN